MEKRSFFEGYRPTNLTADPLPLKVLNHSIWKAEMLGHALDWASQYLQQKSCPSYLISPLLGKILDEISTADLSDCYAKSYGRRMADEVDSDLVEENINYQPLKLMQSVTTAVDNICLRYKEENDRIEMDFPAQSPEEAVVTSTDPDSLPLTFGTSYHAIKNTRRTMEDRMVVLPDIDKVFHLKGRANYFAVFDGHNGVEAAAYSAAHLHRYLVSSPDFPDDLPAAFNYAFEATDTALLMKCRDESIRSGTTAVVALIVPNNIYVAWAGDSQAFLVRNARPESLVSPHKPDREDEMRRIKSLGGEVISISGTWRVNGNLAVSRAIGNPDYKEYVTSTPEITHIVTNGTEEFLILACDGLWDVVSPQRSVDILKEALLSEDPSDIDTVGHKLVKEAKKSGSGDNITVVVVFLKSKEDLIKAYAGNKKMNGTTEGPVAVSQPEALAEAKAPVAPSSTAPTSKASPASAGKTVSSSSPTKAGGPAGRSSLNKTSPNVKPPARLPDRRPTTKAPAAASKPASTTTSATKTAVQKDASAASTTAAGGARPAPRRPIGAGGVTSRTQVTSKTATSTTTTTSTATATRKSLKPEETEKSGATKSTVPPRARPGTAPLSSRVTSTAGRTAKVEPSKNGEESKEAGASKRSVLKTSVTARAVPPKQPASAAAPKPRVPATNISSTTTRPTSASQAPKMGAVAAAAKKALASSTAAASARLPAKKPAGSTTATAVKKDASKVNGQPMAVPKPEKKTLPAKNTKGTESGAPAAKVNGISSKPAVNGEPIAEITKAVNGLDNIETHQIVEKTVETVEAPISVTKVDDSQAIIAPVEKISESSVDLLGNAPAGEQKELEDIVTISEDTKAAPTSLSDKIDSQIESHVLNGDMLGHVENFVVTTKSSEVTENQVENQAPEKEAVEDIQVENQPSAVVNEVSSSPAEIVPEVNETVVAQQESPVTSASPDLRGDDDSSKAEPVAVADLLSEQVQELEIPVEIQDERSDVEYKDDKPAEDTINFNYQTLESDTAEEKCAQVSEVPTSQSKSENLEAAEILNDSALEKSGDSPVVPVVESGDENVKEEIERVENVEEELEKADLTKAEIELLNVENPSNADGDPAEDVTATNLPVESQDADFSNQVPTGGGEEHEIVISTEHVDNVVLEASSPEPVPDSDVSAVALSPEPPAVSDVPVAMSPQPAAYQENPSVDPEGIDDRIEFSPEVRADEGVSGVTSPEPCGSEGIPAEGSPEPARSEDSSAAASPATPYRDIPVAVSPELTPDHEAIAAVSPAHEQEMLETTFSPEPLVEQDAAGVMSPEPLEDHGSVENMSSEPAVDHEETKEIPSEAFLPSSSGLEEVSGEITFESQSAIADNLKTDLNSTEQLASPDLFSDVNAAAAPSPEPMKTTGVAEVEEHEKNETPLLETHVEDVTHNDNLEVGSNSEIGEKNADFNFDPLEEPPVTTDQPLIDPESKAEEHLGDILLPETAQNLQPLEELLQYEEPQQESPPSAEHCNLFGTASEPHVDPEDVDFTKPFSEPSGNPFSGGNPFEVKDETFGFGGTEISVDSSSAGGIPEFTGSGFENFGSEMKAPDGPGFQEIDDVFRNVECSEQIFKKDDFTWGSNNGLHPEGQNEQMFHPMGRNFSTFGAQEVPLDPFDVPLLMDAPVANGNKFSEIKNEVGTIELQHQTECQEALLDAQASSPVPPSERIHSTLDPGSHVDAVGN